MSWTDWFTGNKSKEPSSANAAADRLRVIVQTDQRLSQRLSGDKIDQMKREILAVVNHYVNGVNMEDVMIKQRTEADVHMLEMNINLPDTKVTR